ncbi:MAG: methylmalonyl-CoA mutase family protein [Cyclobacteriaceae bacterium]
MDWEKIAMQEIQKKNPSENLSWSGKDKILFLPYYDAEDVARIPFPNVFDLPAAIDDPAGPRLWSNLPAITVSDEPPANLSALNHLSLGGDGVLFDFQNIRHPDFSRLLQNIQWPHCTLAFRAHSEGEFLKPLRRFISESYDPASLKGALFWESIPKTTNADFFVHSCKNFKSLGLIVPPAAPTEEISGALFKGIKTVEAFSGESPSADVLRSVCFSISVGACIPESIAKLKALRMLWYQVARSYGHHDFKRRDLVIHARSTRAKDGLYAPHENMLKGTFSAIAAIMGGCDSLTVECEEQPPLVARQARNISTILREESFFNQMADPFAGSYAVDVITNAIAEKAWSMFQEKCQRL